MSNKNRGENSGSQANTPENSGAATMGAGTGSGGPYIGQYPVPDPDVLGRGDAGASNYESGATGPAQDREDRVGQSTGLDNTINSGGDVTPEDITEGGFVGSMPGPGTGGIADVTGGGETRGDVSGTLGIATGAATGNKGLEGQDVNSTGAGRADITGGGTAQGLGGTSGGGTA